VTRALARSLPAEVTITATDLVPGMLARGERIGTDRPVTWRQADVMALPFASEAFDVVVCQFGVMFFNPKAAAFAEMRRVLRPGGRLLFVVWDGLDRNDVVDTVSEVVKAFFPDDPPNFIERTPHGYHDPEVIAADLAAGGFTAAPRIERVEHVSRAATAAIAAVAYCEGTPIRGEIEQRSPEALPAVIAAVTTAIAKRFGPTNVAGRISAQIVDVNR
jgi:SAM-dependent methyltransferase